MVPGTTALILFFATGVAEEQRAPGRAVAGLRVAILLVTEVSISSAVPVTLELCNATDEDIPIDKWRGLWFVDVRDSGGQMVPHTRAVDVARAINRPAPLPARSCWNTELEDLCLMVGSPESSPLWEYEPLESGVYVLRAEYRSEDRAAYLLYQKHHPDWPIPWIGDVVSGDAVLSVR